MRASVDQATPSHATVARLDDVVKEFIETPLPDISRHVVKAIGVRQKGACRCMNYVRVFVASLLIGPTPCLGLRTVDVPDFLQLLDLGSSRPNQI